MNTHKSKGLWFPEPSVSDPTYSPDTGPAEPTTRWLARSTLGKARALRAFLNTNLAEFPEDYQESLYRRMQKQWRSALHELVVVRTLQVMGADVTVEVANPNGTQPDFLAVFPDTTVVVEATSPMYNPGFGKDFERWRPLQHIIKRLAPPSWIIYVHHLPLLELHGGYGDFKQVVGRLLRGLDPPTDDSSEVVLSTTLEDASVLGYTIEFHLVPSPHRDRPSYLVGPGSAHFDNTAETIRKTVNNSRKLRQARSSPYPVLLAIDAPSLQSTANTREFDIALYGRRITVGSQGDSPRREEFEASGEWTRGGVGRRPVFAGILAFLGIEYTGGSDPVLYPHPCFDGNLPEAILALAQHRYDPNRPGISVQPVTRLGAMKRIAWMDRDVLENDVSEDAS